ncbi:MAG: chemotaxis protein CheX [Bryobacteraceae bacterium]|nr:chemotaxis protein CheX [Bryobacteraceae bacterium]
MNEAALMEGVAAVLEQVMETMFFTTLVGEVDVDPAQPLLRAQVHYSGTVDGACSLGVSPEAARSVAANFLGQEEASLQTEQVEEVICELANIVCGALLSRAYPGGSFRLGTPYLVERPPEYGFGRAFLLDSGIVEIFLAPNAS